MNLLELQNFDPSISLVGGQPNNIRVEGISNSDNPRTNTVVFLKNKKYLNQLGLKSETLDFSTCLLLIEKSYEEKLTQEETNRLKKSFILLGTVEKVDHSMCLLSKPFYDEKFLDMNYQVDGRQMGNCVIHANAELAQGVFVGENVKIGSGTKILPGCTILPNVEIGENTLIFPNVTLYPFTQIGSNCRIHAGTVIGTDGFGYNFFNGQHQKIWHLSGVIIKDNVEIGANTMIDAGAFTPTEIGNGTKIDNDVQISHNVKIGEHVIICGKTGIAGSVDVKNYCGFGAGAGVAPGAILEEGVQIAARAVVSENAVVKSGSIFAGHPARPLKEWLRTQAEVRKLLKKE